MSEATLPQVKRFQDEFLDFFARLPEGGEAVQSLFSSGVSSAVLEAAAQGLLSIDILDRVRVALGLKGLSFTKYVIMRYPSAETWNLHSCLLMPEALRQIPGAFNHWREFVRQDSFVNSPSGLNHVTFEFFPLVEKQTDKWILGEMERRKLRPLCGFEFFMLLATHPLLGTQTVILPCGCTAAVVGMPLDKQHLFVRPDHKTGRKVVHILSNDASPATWGGKDLLVVGVSDINKM